MKKQINAVRSTGYALANDSFVKASVLLAGLERAQSWRPASFVRVFHQLGDELRRTVALDERSLDDCLQHGVWCRDHAAPARDASRRQC